MHSDGDPLAFWRGCLRAMPLSLLAWVAVVLGVRAIW